SRRWKTLGRKPRTDPDRTVSLRAFGRSSSTHGRERGCAGRVTSSRFDRPWRAYMRRAKLTRRGRRVVVGLAVATAALVGVAVVAIFAGHSPIVHPADPCATPPPLRTSHG